MSSRNIPGVPRDGRRHSPSSVRQPAIVLQPKTYNALQAGINMVADAVRPTLGPLPRLVLMERLRRTDAPEFLDDAATIARRIIEVRPRSCDVGAMMLRQALWKMQKEVGDGGATMAVMYQTIVNEGIRSIAQFGCNPMLLRAALEKSIGAVLKVLSHDSTPLVKRENVSSMALGMCQGDLELANMLGEIFDIVGVDGLVVVEKWTRPGLEREYVEGTFWNLSGWFSRQLVSEPLFGRTIFEEASILISDLVIREPEQVLGVLEKCHTSGIKRLVIIAAEFGDRAIGLLVNNNKANTIQSVAVRVPRIAEMDRVAAMEDIAVLTGGKAFYSATNDTFSSFDVADLGHARRAWATESLFGMYGGSGEPRARRNELEKIRERLSCVADGHERRMLQQRIGRFAGGTAILRIGGHTTAQIDSRHEMAERAVASLRLAIQGGVVAGGGAALMAARSALVSLSVNQPEDAIAHRILSRALEEPMRAIVENCGMNSDLIIEKVSGGLLGIGFESYGRQITDMRDAGVYDASRVLTKALEVAVSGAAIVLTTDVIVHHRQPKESIDP